MKTNFEVSVWPYPLGDKNRRMPFVSKCKVGRCWLGLRKAFKDSAWAWTGRSWCRVVVSSSWLLSVFERAWLSLDDHYGSEHLDIKLTKLKIYFSICEDSILGADIVKIVFVYFLKILFIEPQFVKVNAYQ